MLSTNVSMGIIVRSTCTCAGSVRSVDSKSASPLECGQSVSLNNRFSKITMCYFVIII